MNNMRYKLDFDQSDQVFQLFINMSMKKGKKSLAYRILNEALFLLKDVIRSEFNDKTKTKNNLFPFHYSSKDLLKAAIDVVKPVLEVRKVRVAARVLQVPAIVTKKRSYHLAIKWILLCAKKRQQVSRSMIEKTDLKKKKFLLFSYCLALELKEVLKKPFQGITVANSAVQMKEDVHRLALNNRAFYHYRWWKR